MVTALVAGACSREGTAETTLASRATTLAGANHHCDVIDYGVIHGLNDDHKHCCVGSIGWSALGFTSYDVPKRPGSLLPPRCRPRS